MVYVKRVTIRMPGELVDAINKVSRINRLNNATIVRSALGNAYRTYGNDYLRFYRDFNALPLSKKRYALQHGDARITVPLDKLNIQFVEDASKALSLSKSNIVRMALLLYSDILNALP